MLRFSIRDVLWLMLVVGLAIGWWLNRWQLNYELGKARAWRTRAGALEYLMREDGWEIEWDFASSKVVAKWPVDEERRRNIVFFHTGVSTTEYAPSADP